MVDTIALFFRKEMSPAAGFEKVMFFIFLTLVLVWICLFVLANRSMLFSTLRNYGILQYRTLLVVEKYFITFTILISITIRCYHLWWELQALPFLLENMIGEMYGILISFGSLAIMLIGFLFLNIGTRVVVVLLQKKSND